MRPFAPRGGAADLPLPPREIHLWVVALDPPAHQVAALRRSLTAAERERAARFRFARHRRRYEVGRGALRHLLAGYTGIPAAEIPFVYGRRGKPLLAPDLASDLHFNLSNSAELALAGFVRGEEIGVDVEHLRPMPNLERLATRFFCAGESAELRRLPEAERLEGFFQCWTRKEAYLKTSGEGLAARLDSFEVTLAPHDAPRMVTLEGDAERAARWSLQTFRPRPTYIGALAVEAPPMPVRTWRLDLAAATVTLGPA